MFAVDGQRGRMMSESGRVRSRWRRSAIAGLALLAVAGACGGDGPTAQPSGSAGRQSTTTSEAEPQVVTIADGRDDAYRDAGVRFLPPPGQAADAGRSDGVADLIDAEFRTVARVASTHTYRVTLRINKDADPTYNYWVGGKFGSDCDLFHSLGLGADPKGRVFCERASKFIGELTAVRVSGADGSTLAAEFSYDPQAAPSELSADPVLRRLYAYSCMQGEKGFGCGASETIDYARDNDAVFHL